MVSVLAQTCRTCSKSTATIESQPVNVCFLSGGWFRCPHTCCQGASSEHTQLTEVWTHTHTHTHTPIHTYTHLYTPIHTYAHLCTPIHTYTRLYTPRHTYTHLYTHTPTHANTHTHTSTDGDSETAAHARVPTHVSSAQVAAPSKLKTKAIMFFISRCQGHARSLKDLVCIVFQERL